MIKKSRKPYPQIERTKSWILDALMRLMDKNKYSEITVSDICKKAGVARPTFYRYYKDKVDVIKEYIMNTHTVELLTIEKDNKEDSIVLVFDYQFMLQNKKNLKKIISYAEIENYILSDIRKFQMVLIRHYKEKLTAEEYLICRYKLCYQVTGSLNMFLDWFINDMPMPVESIVSMINAMNISKAAQFRNIPSFVIKLKNE